MTFETKMTFEDWSRFIKEKYHGKSILLVHVIAVICLIFACKYYMSGSGALYIYYIFIAVFFEGFQLYRLNNIMKVNQKYFRDTYKGQDLILTYSFYEKTFDIHNSFTGETTSFEYSKFAELRETEHYLIVEAYGRQTFTFDRAAADEHKLLEFFHEKNPNAKVSRYKKFILF